MRRAAHRVRSGTAAVAAVAMALCVAGLAMAADAAAVTPAPRPLVLRAARLFDAVAGRMVEPGVVVIRGERIAAVGRDAELPAGAEVIDLGDATLLPGLIDAHVHLSTEGSDNWYRDQYEGLTRFPAEQALRAARHARLTLEAGITTVRDLGSTDYIALGLRNAIEAGAIPGPRMLVANYAIGSTGGHADADPVPPQRVAEPGIAQGVCNGPEACRQAVREQIKFGADVIKFMPSGGVLSLADSVDAPELTQEEMNAIVAEAHTWGRKVAAHCHGDRAAKMALAAGVDSIEHGSFLKDDTLLAMKKQHVFLVPTLSAGEWIGAKADRFPPAIAAKARAAAASMFDMFRRAVRLGVPVAMGTDAAVEPHGRNAHEFVLMVQDGMTSAQALVAGTMGGAELLGLGDQVGSLQAGKRADVIAVAGDALADITRVEPPPVLVMKDGVIVRRPAALAR